MPPMQSVSLTLLPLLLAACEQQPAAPDHVIRPEFEATHSDVTTIFDLVSDPADCSANPRIGEIVLETGHITVVTRTMTASSGNVMVTGFAIYDPSNYIVGQTSGRVWTIDAARTHPVFHDNVHGAGESVQVVWNEYWTNANGARLTIRGPYHLTLNANGTVAVERPTVWECIGG